MTASDGGLYKLLIVGGGPAGIGVLVRAARIGLIARLLNPTLHGDLQDLELSKQLGMKQKGVAIVHDGDESTFGSGNLGKYIINSNTFARSLLSSVLHEKPDLDPPESIKNTFLERAKEHESTKKLEAAGNAPMCLIDFGHFLRNVGDCLLKDLEMYADMSKCVLNSRATRFERLESGIYRVEVIENGHEFILYAEHLVLAMGGKQQLPMVLENSPAYKAKSFLSEHCLSEDGFTKLHDHLLQTDGRKVCIAGGSHSSFSVAWLLLHKGKTYRSKILDQSNQLVVGVNCNADSTIRDSSEKHDALRSPIVPVAKAKECNHKTDEEVVSSITALKTLTLEFRPRDITILHRSPVRCYYLTRKDAEADGADGSRCDRTGCVNTFTGLREDSKHLYKDIKAGKEPRVRLFQVNQHGRQSLVTKAYDSANAIVWCCGYNTRMIPGFDEKGRAFTFCGENGVVKLDMQARLQILAPTKAVVAASNLYGVGLGFSLRSHVDEMGTETRADGVTVYHRRGASLVLAALFGPGVFGRDSTSFEEMVEKNDKCRKKKELPSSGVDSRLMDKVKRPANQVATAESSPTRLPSNPATALSNATCRASELLPLPERSCQLYKAMPARHFTLAAQVPNEETGWRRKSPAASDHCAASSATNPPVKMLLQRRRSAEALGTAGPTNRSSRNQSDAVKARSNSGFAPKVTAGRCAPLAATS